MQHAHKCSMDDAWVGSSAVSLLTAQMSIVADAVSNKRGQLLGQSGGVGLADERALACCDICSTDHDGTCPLKMAMSTEELLRTLERQVDLNRADTAAAKTVRKQTPLRVAHFLAPVTLRRVDCVCSSTYWA